MRTGTSDAPAVLVFQTDGSTEVAEGQDLTGGLTRYDEVQIVLAHQPTAPVMVQVTPEPTRLNVRPPAVAAQTRPD